MYDIVSLICNAEIRGVMLKVNSYVCHSTIMFIFNH